MNRVAKKPQYEAFNQLTNCYGRYQKHASCLEVWRDFSYPLMLEIGAGTARIAMAFSLHHPAWQVIALDRKSDRLYKAARTSQRSNLVFLQTELVDLDDYLACQNQLHLIWLTFPDPYPLMRQAKHRLTFFKYMQFYKNLLHPQGLIRLKTDSKALFEDSQQNFVAAGFKINCKQTNLATCYQDYSLDVQTITQYEEKFLKLGLPIYYLEIELK